ncbi:MAG TPA: pyridoxine 5'-phosphate synthase [Thioalkalivibrio sp.]|mgnify:FL=1|nr:pyridoxine 5'-phosphate synthase [Thioalkalivibrio sp.]
MKLGVNIDHVATIRQARGTPYPDLMRAIREAEAGGADAITMHLREDRRHIQDADVFAAREVLTTRLNLEMAATSEMVGIAGRVKPEECCLVPERREELTTEGGLDVIGQRDRLQQVCAALAEVGARVSLFIEPEPAHLDVAREIGAPVVELHTGAYANRQGEARARELERIRAAVAHGTAIGLQVNAGHGLDYENTQAVAAMREIVELNIGHAIVARALFVGLRQAVAEMKAIMTPGG